MYYFDPQRFLTLEALVAQFPLAFSGGQASVNSVDSATLDYTAISYWRPIAGTSETESVISPGPATLGPFVTAGDYILAVLTPSNTISTELVATATVDSIPLASFTVALSNGPITALVDLRSAYGQPSSPLLSSHIIDTSNPHGTDINNLGSGTLAELNTAVTDATLVNSGDIVNADINAAAAIDESKLALSFATHANTNDPTTDQKAALVGTDGAPSGANPYVTDSDPRVDVSNITKVLGTITVADMFASSTPLLATVTTGKSMIVTALVFKVTTAATTIVTIPSAGVEVGSGTGLFDVIANESLNGLGAPGTTQESFILSPAGGTLRIGDSTEVIHLNLTGGSGTGTLVCDVDLIGYEY